MGFLIAARDVSRVIRKVNVDAEYHGAYTVYVINCEAMRIYKMINNKSPNETKSLVTNCIVINVISDWIRKWVSRDNEKEGIGFEKRKENKTAQRWHSQPASVFFSSSTAKTSFSIFLVFSDKKRKHS